MASYDIPLTAAKGLALFLDFSFWLLLFLQDIAASYWKFVACTPSCDHRWGSGSLGTLFSVSCGPWHGALCLHSWNNFYHSHVGQCLYPLHWGPCALRTCSCFYIGSCSLWSLGSPLQSWLFGFPWDSLLDPPSTSLLFCSNNLTACELPTSAWRYRASHSTMKSLVVSFPCLSSQSSFCIQFFLLVVQNNPSISLTNLVHI